MKYRIGHLAFRTADMARTLDFYVNKLNFTHAFSIADNDNRPWIEYLMAGDGRFIEFFHPGADSVPNAPGSYLHLCLEVEDIHAAVAELEAKGVDIRVQINRGKDKNYQAWIRDPDGRDIELMQLDPESPQAHAQKNL